MTNCFQDSDSSLDDDALATAHGYSIDNHGYSHADADATEGESSADTSSDDAELAAEFGYSDGGGVGQAIVTALMNSVLLLAPPMISQKVALLLAQEVISQSAVPLLSLVVMVFQQAVRGEEGSYAGLGQTMLPVRHDIVACQYVTVLFFG